jgi:hypothetical protein
MTSKAIQYGPELLTLGMAKANKKEQQRPCK